MRECIQIGATHAVRLVVGPDNTAAAMGNPGVQVFGTPAVLLLVEQTAYEMVQPYLEDGESAVGTHVEIDHVAPALPGTTVTCTARLIGIKGRRLTFEFEVCDAHETLARGRYANYVLLLEPFLRRAASKAADQPARG